jgi:lysophospholipase L1-like esterase
MAGPGIASSWRSGALNSALVVAAAAVGFLALEVADFAVGLVARPLPAGLIFPPNSEAAYKTTEFSITAKVNSLGFRDREFGARGSLKCRVVAIGDSFTFGWGVAIEKSWPKVLEANLEQHGFSVEVANLGFPGGAPADYAAIAEKAVPMLQPDLVIVGVLQGDDLVSADAGPRIGVGGKGPIRSAMERFARRLFPHLMEVFDARRYRTSGLPSSAVSATWQEQVRDILAGLSDAEKVKYGQMAPAIRGAFESGNLNPSTMSAAIRRPEYFIETFDIKQPHTQALIGQMSTQLARIVGSAASRKAAVVVASVPFGLYASHQQFDVRQNGLKFVLDPHMLTSSAPDDAIQQAAETAGAVFVKFTDAFRARDGQPLFFQFDGHFTGAGHRLFADQLTPVVAAKLQALPAGCRN